MGNVLRQEDQVLSSCELECSPFVRHSGSLVSLWHTCLVDCTCSLSLSLSSPLFARVRNGMVAVQCWSRLCFLLFSSFSETIRARVLLVICRLDSVLWFEVSIHMGWMNGWLGRCDETPPPPSALGLWEARTDAVVGFRNGRGGEAIQARWE